MKLFLKLLILFSILGLTSLVLSPQVFAQATQSGQTTIKASIPSVMITLQGWSSPFASIALTVSDNFLSSTTASDSGAFTFQSITVQKSIKEFCFDITDYKRLGEAKACIPGLQLSNGEIINEIFLPPTLGILSQKLKAGDNATLYGYSRPESTVKISSEDGQQFSVKADKEGYYSYVINKIREGNYSFSAKASLENKESLDPQKSLSISVLSASIESLPPESKGIIPPIGSSYFWIIVIFLLLLALSIAAFFKRKKIAEFLKERLGDKNLLPTREPENPTQIT